MGKNLAMTAITSAVSIAGGVAGAGAGILGGFAGAALKTGISVSGELTGKLLSGGIMSNWNWEAIGSQWNDWDDWKGTAINMVGSAVGSGLEATILGNTITEGGKITGYTKALGLTNGQTGKVKTLASTVGNLASTAMDFGINGETTINILNISDFLGKTKLSGTSSGLLALTVGKNGVSGELSSAGRNFSATTIAETIGGIGVADTIGWTNRYERKHSGDWGEQSSELRFEANTERETGKRNDR